MKEPFQSAIHPLDNHAIGFAAAVTSAMPNPAETGRLKGRM